MANIDKLCGFRGASLNDVHRTVRVRSAYHSTTSRFFQQRMISQRDALFPLPVCGVAEQVHWGGQTDRQTDRERRGVKHTVVVVGRWEIDSILRVIVCRHAEPSIFRDFCPLFLQRSLLRQMCRYLLLTTTLAINLLYLIVLDNNFQNLLGILFENAIMNSQPRVLSASRNRRSFDVD